MQRNRQAQVKRQLKQAGLTYYTCPGYLDVEGDKYYPKTTMWETASGVKGRGIENLIKTKKLLFN